MAGTVKRANVKEGRDGKSRGLGTVTFELPLEAIQAVGILFLMVAACECGLPVFYEDFKALKLNKPF